LEERRFDRSIGMGAGVAMAMRKATWRVWDGWGRSGFAEGLCGLLLLVAVVEVVAVGAVGAQGSRTGRTGREQVFAGIWMVLRRLLSYLRARLARDCLRTGSELRQLADQRLLLKLPSTISKASALKHRPFRQRRAKEPSRIDWRSSV